MPIKPNPVVDAAAADLMLEGILERIDDPDPLLRFLADEVLDYEADVFATAGFGAWAPLDPSTVRAKGSGRVLVDTGGLLDELTHPRAGTVQISGDTVTVATDDPKAGYLARGARGMPKRDPAPEPPATRLQQWADDLLDFLLEGRR